MKIERVKYKIKRLFKKKEEEEEEEN